MKTKSMTIDEFSAAYDRKWRLLSNDVKFGLCRDQPVGYAPPCSNCLDTYIPPIPFCEFIDEEV